MGLSLAEYARNNPSKLTDEPIPTPDHSLKERSIELEQAERLKEIILNKLEQGTAPQQILFAAIKTIGILSRDGEWADSASEMLNGIYHDLEQESFLVDNKAVELQRIEKMQEEYKQKLKRSVSRHLAGCRRIEAALNQIANELD